MSERSFLSMDIMLIEGGSTVSGEFGIVSLSCMSGSVCSVVVDVSIFSSTVEELSNDGKAEAEGDTVTLEK